MQNRPWWWLALYQRTVDVDDYDDDDDSDRGSVHPPHFRTEIGHGDIFVLEE